MPTSEHRGEDRPLAPWRQRLFEIIFESDTRLGWYFDIVLLWAIVLSVIAVLVESVPSVIDRHDDEFRIAEWVFTALFTVEYVGRLIAVRRPLAYATSFYGIVDLLAILPSWIGLVVPGAHELLVVRVLRLLRIFRILKLGRFLIEANVLVNALRASRPKIIVFLTFVGAVVIIAGALMHVIERGNPGFSSIPQSMYWAIVTLCTVGYGDVVPHSPIGKLFASLLMITGYGILAVPTGIVSVELARATPGRPAPSGQSCPACTRAGHEVDAAFCKFCGAELNPPAVALPPSLPAPPGQTSS